MSKKELKVDDLKVDLWAILETQSETFHTELMGEEVRRQLDAIPGVTYRQDEYGNIYATRGEAETYPAFVCHIDTVHPIKEGYQVFRHESGMYFAMTWNGKESKLEQAGVGGDDKCGIIACLELLHRLKNVKCAFFLDEEKGCKGSENGDLTFFEDCRYAVQIDRKHGQDIIWEGSGTVLCSDEFKNIVTEIGKAWGYAPCTGMNTDVVKLKTRGLGISCINISAGYWNPHGKNEFISETNLMWAINFCIAISKDKKVYPHAYVPKVYAPSTTTTHSTSGRGVGGREWKAPIYSRPVCLQCDATLKYTEEDAQVCDNCWGEIFKSDQPGLYLVSDERKQLYLVDESVFLDEDDEDLYGPTVEESILPRVLHAMLPTTVCLRCSVPLHFDHEKKVGYCDRDSECKVEGCRSKLRSPHEWLLQKCGNHVEEGQEPGVCQTFECLERLNTEQEKKTKICGSCVSMYIG